MNKKTILIKVLFLFAGIFFLFLFKVGYATSQQNKIKESINTLPEFQFKKTSDVVFRNNDLIEGYPTLLIYFSLDCDYCQSELKIYQKRKNSFF